MPALNVSHLNYARGYKAPGLRKTKVYPVRFARDSYIEFLTNCRREGRRPPDVIRALVEAYNEARR